MAAFDPLADTLAAALRTLVLWGVVSAIAGLPAAAIARRRAAGSPRWLAILAGPELVVHALNLLLGVVLTVWLAVDTLAGSGGAVTAWQIVLFAASFWVPNLAGIAAWHYVERRAPRGDVPHVVPAEAMAPETAPGFADAAPAAQPGAAAEPPPLESAPVPPPPPMPGL